MLWLKNIIEVAFGMGLFVNGALFIPQAIRLYKTKDARGLSLLTFAGFNFIQFLTILHAALHKDVILFSGTVFSFTGCAIVTLLIMRYKHK